MIIILLFVGGVSAFFMAMGLDRTNPGNSFKSRASVWFGCIAVMTWVVGAVGVLGILITYPISLSTLSDLENFHERNYLYFAGAVEEFPDAATVMTKEDTSTKQMLSYKYVHAVLRYNRELKWYRMYQDHWFLAPFVGRVSDELEFINRGLTITLSPQLR